MADIIIPVSVEWFSALKYLINGIFISLLSDELLILLRRFSDNHDLRRRGYLTRHFRGNRVFRAGFVCRKDLSFPWWMLGTVAVLLVVAELVVEFGAGARDVREAYVQKGLVTDKVYIPPSSGGLKPFMERDQCISSLLYNCSDFSYKQDESDPQERRPKVRVKALMYHPDYVDTKGAVSEISYNLYCDGDYLPNEFSPNLKRFGRDATFYLPFRFSLNRYKGFMNETFREVVKNIRFARSPVNEVSNFELEPCYLRIRNIRYTDVHGLIETQKLAEALVNVRNVELGKCLLWISSPSPENERVYVQVGSCIFSGAEHWRLLASGLYNEQTTWEKNGGDLHIIQNRTRRIGFGLQPLVSFRASEQLDERLLLYAGMEGTARAPHAGSIDTRIMSVLMHRIPHTVNEIDLRTETVNLGMKIVRPTLKYWAVALLISEIIIITGGILLLVMFRERRWDDLRRAENLAYCWWAEKMGVTKNPTRQVHYTVPALVEEGQDLRLTAIADHEVTFCIPPNPHVAIFPELPRKRRGRLRESQTRTEGEWPEPED